MFNQDTMKELSKLYLKTHSINTKLKVLDFEQELFFKDEKEYLLSRNELELEMLDVIKQIGAVSNNLWYICNIWNIVCKNTVKEIKMSRTKKGIKPLNCDYDYWSKRIGNKGGGSWIGRSTKKETLSRERMQESVLFRKETDRYCTDNQEDYVYDLTNEPFYRSLFPKATKIGYYESITGDLVLEVDGKYFGYLEQWEEIMSFQYFTGCSFIDHKDAMEQYAEYLEANERGAWLP